MPVVIGLMILITAAGLLAWCCRRAWRLKNTLLRSAIVGLAGLLATAISSADVLTLMGFYRLHARSAPTPDLKIAGTPAQIQRGQAIANSFCAACHSQTGHLTGGIDLATHLEIPLGSFVSANLTAVGRLSHWSDGQVFRAIRNGIDAEGNWLIIMSYTNAGKLSDDDIQAVIAYLRSQPAAGTATRNPPDQLNPLGLILLGAGMLPQGKPVFAGAVKAPPRGATASYGEYISWYQDCRECHGATLKGGVPGQLAPMGPDLDLVKAWKLEEFIATMRSGTDPGGHQMGDRMPWRFIGKLDDEELTALYDYLTGLGGPRAIEAN